MNKFLKYHQWISLNENSGLSTEEYEVLKQYQNGLIVGQVQKMARGFLKKSTKNKEYDKTERELIIMESVINKTGRNFPKGTEVWRGVSDKKIYGKYHIDKGFTSVSKTYNDTVSIFSDSADLFVKQGIHSDGMIMRIIFNESIKCIDINHTLKTADIDGTEQDELILPRFIKFTLTEDDGIIKTYRISKSR